MHRGYAQIKGILDNLHKASLAFGTLSICSDVHLNEHRHVYVCVWFIRFQWYVHGDGVWLELWVRIFVCFLALLHEYKRSPCGLFHTLGWLPADLWPFPLYDVLLVFRATFTTSHCIHHRQRLNSMRPYPQRFSFADNNKRKSTEHYSEFHVANFRWSVLT